MHDADDNLVSMVDPGGHARTQNSGERGLLREQTDPLGAASKYDYDACGQLVTHTNRMTC